ncbi:MAG: hypothetical protein KME15_02465 [Drouetiella hepatica Uher 2000/2452]|uniref:Uncharacterized protein n=1 Tax=Drouetiella hepatica Uher 2000/2452 TaxID=904376 RepID=A0A951Q6Z1_9CYAN|nr:hypothetical protein [Drouetiella hepatica Uher 2000/2452]
MTGANWTNASIVDAKLHVATIGDSQSFFLQKS